jgi:hypothetical protein
MSSSTDDGQIGCNLNMLHKLLKKLVASREEMVSGIPVSSKEGKNPIDEVEEAIEIPSLDPKALNSDTAELSPMAISQLRDYVTEIHAFFINFYNIEFEMKLARCSNS